MKRIYSLEVDETRKTVYRCECNFCKAMMEIEPDEFRYVGGWKLAWGCKNCNRFVNQENIVLLQRKKVTYGPQIKFDVEK